MPAAQAKEWVPTFTTGDQGAKEVRNYRTVPEPGYINLHARPSPEAQRVENFEDVGVPRQIYPVPRFEAGETPEGDTLRMLFADSEDGNPKLVYGFVMTRAQWEMLPTDHEKFTKFEWGDVHSLMSRLPTVTKEQEELCAKQPENIEPIEWLKSFVPDETDMDLTRRDVYFALHFDRWRKLVWCFVVEQTPDGDRLVGGFKVGLNLWLVMRYLGDLLFKVRDEWSSRC